jgi:hypothetical protein
MTTASLGTGFVSCLLLTFAAGIAQAQEAKPPVAPSPPTVQTITVINGPNVTHHYIVQGGSPHLEARYLETELAEDQVVLAQSLSQLKLDYVQNERIADRLRLAQLSPGSPAPYYAPVYYAHGDCPGYPGGDLLIKSSIAPQLGPAATYEDGVRAIRTWENAKVEALKTLEEERSGAGPAAVKKPAPVEKPAPVKKPAAPGKTQSNPPPQDQKSQALVRNSNVDNRRVILASLMKVSPLMTVGANPGMEATSPDDSAASTPPPAEEGLPLGVHKGLCPLDTLGIALGLCLGLPLFAIKLWLQATA